MPNYKPSATENILRLIGIHTVHKSRDPLPSDTNYGVPTLWVNDSSEKAFILILDDGSAGTWLDLGEAPFPRNFDNFYDASLAPPVASAGDSYILGNQTPVDAGWTAIGATNDDYVEYTGSSWVDYTPQVGQISYSNDLTDFYIYDGSDWIKLSGSISALTYTSDSRNPNTSDNSYTVPTLWIDTSSDTGYLLTDVTASIATWIKLSNNQLGDAQDSVKSIATSTAPPPTEVNGDRYILDSSGAPDAAWDGASQGDIVQYDGASWVAFTPTEGTFCEVEDEDTVYIFITSWVKLFQYTGASFTTDGGSATPSDAGVLGIVGTAAQGILTAGTGNNVIVTANDATTAQKGVLETATDAEAIAVTATDKALVPGNVAPLLAEPPAIGGTTPSSGAFTDLSATGAFKLYDTDDSNTVNLVWNEDDSSDRTVNLTVDAADRTFALHGNLTVEAASLLNQDLTTDANPSFAGLTLTSTPLNVASGGSGRASHTAYAVLCGGTTATGAQQSIASVGNSGQILTSNGAGALPTFQTIPAATDVYDNTFRILDDVDNTKEIAFEAAGISTGTTRTITMPDKNVNLATATTTNEGIVSELATDAEAQAKSDTSRVLTPSNLAALDASDTASGLVELATDAEAVAVTATDRAVTPANLAAVFPEPPALGGTTAAAVTGTTITANTKYATDGDNDCDIGDSTNAFKDIYMQGDLYFDNDNSRTQAHYCWVPLLVANPSSVASVDFDLSSYTAYDRFKVVFHSVLPSSNGREIYMRTSTDGGSTWDSTAGNYYGCTETVFATSQTQKGSIATGSETSMRIADVNRNNSGGTYGELLIFDLATSSRYTHVQGHFGMVDSSGTPQIRRCSSSWVRQAFQTDNAIQFYFSSGNIASGKIIVYGQTNI